MFGKLSKLFHKNEDDFEDKYNWSCIGSNYSIPHYTPVSLICGILQDDLLDDLLTRIGQYIKLRIDDPNKVNYHKEHISPDTLNFIQTYARLGLFDDQNNLYGILYGSTLEQCGRSIGEWVDCIISISLSECSPIELYVPDLRKNNIILDFLNSVKKKFTKLDNHEIKTVANYFGFDTTRISQVHYDYNVTKHMYNKIYKKYGDKLFAYAINTNN